MFGIPHALTHVGKDRGTLHDKKSPHYFRKEHAGQLFSELSISKHKQETVF